MDAEEGRRIVDRYRELREQARRLTTEEQIAEDDQAAFED